MTNQNDFCTIKDCCQQWVNSLSKMTDYDLINEVKNGNKCFLDNAQSFVKAFNFSSNWVSIDFELPAEQWGHPWHLTITSQR